jgi:4-hydroxybenzoate polyprenyltransferase
MSGYLTRMRRYLAEMLPLPGHLLVAALTHLGMATYVHHLHTFSSPILSRHGLVGVWSIFNLFLLLRLMDELKDRDIDRDLFPDRPLPAGRVFERDIKASLGLAIAAYLGVNLLVGTAFLSALIVLGYALLMFRLFFMPNTLRGSLPLSLATHTPIVPLMLVHSIDIVAVQNDVSVMSLGWAMLVPFVVMIWCAYLSWEVSRKIRAPEQETHYVTYSRLLGAQGAVLFASAVQATGVAIGLYLLVAQDLSWLYPTGLAIAFLIALWGNLRFLIAPGPRTSNLKRFAETYALVLLATQVVEFGWMV